MSATLTTFQTKLINELTKEFAKLNPPTPVSDGKGRFSIAMIENSLNEKKRFYETTEKYNLTIAEMLKKSIMDEMKKFNKEFGKYLVIQNGRPKDQGVILEYTTVENLMTKAKNPSNSNKAELGVKSKTPTSGYGFTINVWFKTVVDTVTLQNSEVVKFPKIIGLIYSNGDADSLTKNWDWVSSADSLDTLIQKSPKLHKDLTNLCKI